MKRDVIFYSFGAKISGILGFPVNFNEQLRYPAVVINHGYSGNKEEYDLMAEEFNKHGYITLQFDSRGCGKTEALRGRMMCSTEWMEDARSAVTYICQNNSVNPSRIGFTGCSMGGAVTICMAAGDKRVKCAVAMAPLEDGTQLLEKVWTERKGREEWENFLKEIEADDRRLVKENISKFVSVPYVLCMTKKDEEEFHAARDMDEGLVREVPLESVKNSYLEFKPISCCSKIDIPVMLIHGDKDEIVDTENSKNLYDEIKSKKDFVIIIGAPHPLPVCDQKYEVFEHALRWFDENL